MVYQWKNGSHIKSDAEKAGKMCEELEKTVGLTAETLLEANKDENAPLHNEFEWDDTKAAHQYRLTQSRHIINCLCYKADGKETKEPVRAFFNVVAKTSNYESTTKIISSKDKYQMLLEQAYKELQAFTSKYQSLKELNGVFKEIKKLKSVTTSEQAQPRV